MRARRYSATEGLQCEGWRPGMDGTAADDVHSPYAVGFFMLPTVKKAATLAILLSFLAACSPGVYRKPVSDFKAATEQARALYFHQLKSRHQSSVDQFVADRQLTLWVKKADGSSRPWTKKLADRIAEEMGEPLLDATTLAIRQQAFEIVIFYSDALLALASNDDTDALVTEIHGFGIAVQESLTALQTVAELSELSHFIGPFGTAIKVLGKLAEIASKVLRERAIREAILTSDPMVQQIFETLGNEARAAQVDTLQNYERMIGRLKRAIESNNFADRVAKDNVYELYIRTQAVLAKLNNQPNFSILFEQGRRAHSALAQKAADPSLEGLRGRIRMFREEVLAAREALMK